MPHDSVVIWCEDLNGLCRWNKYGNAELFWTSSDFEFVREFKEYHSGRVIVRMFGHPYYGSLLVLDAQGKPLLRYDMPLSGAIRGVVGETPGGSLLLCNNSPGENCDLWLLAEGVDRSFPPTTGCLFPTFLADGSFACVKTADNIEVIHRANTVLMEEPDRVRTENKSVVFEGENAGAFEALSAEEFLISDGIDLWYWSGREWLLIETEEFLWLVREAGRVLFAQCEISETDSSKDCSVSLFKLGGELVEVWRSTEYYPGPIHSLGQEDFLLELLTDDSRPELEIVTISTQ